MGSQGPRGLLLRLAETDVISRPEKGRPPPAPVPWPGESPGPSTGRSDPGALHRRKTVWESAFLRSVLVAAVSQTAHHDRSRAAPPPDPLPPKESMPSTPGALLLKAFCPNPIPWQPGGPLRLLTAGGLQAQGLEGKSGRLGPTGETGLGGRHSPSRGACHVPTPERCRTAPGGAPPPPDLGCSRRHQIEN